MKVSFSEYRQNQKRSPWRVHFRGRDHWYWTEEEAKEGMESLAKNAHKASARLSVRDTDDFLQAREILKGISVLTAARYYVETHREQIEAGGKKVAELIRQFEAKALAGRPKYVAEAKRHLKLLTDSIGAMDAVQVTEKDIAGHLDQFDSKWSHDDALKFARVFFNWTCLPQIAARKTSPAAGFKFKRPHGKKIYLSLEDTEHLLTTCREHFPEIIGPVALQLFAGVRTEEIIRADWSMIRRGMIRLPAEAAKMGERSGKPTPRFIDWWPKALDVWMPSPLPTRGPLVVDVERKENAIGLHHRYRDLKGALLTKCAALKPSFVWGQNAMRHSYGTYGYAFWQSADKIAKLMGERDVDTVMNHYAEYEEQPNGQRFFSTGSKELEELPMSKGAKDIIDQLLKEKVASAGGGAR